MLIWKEPQLYKDTIILMGRFHQLRVRHKTIFKRHSIKSYQKWVVAAETLVFGSAEVAVEGRHYYCNMMISR